jgi:hypothetical protein
MDSQAMSELTDFNEDTLWNKHKLRGRVNMHSVALQTPIKVCKKKTCFKATNTGEDLINIINEDKFN